MKTTDHTTPTLSTVECHHCNELVADRPFPPTHDDSAWELEAREHRLGCAAILTRAGRRLSPVAPAYARGRFFPEGDPMWRLKPTEEY
jgi:hypothetical protein